MHGFCRLMAGPERPHPVRQVTLHVLGGHLRQMLASREKGHVEAIGPAAPATSMPALYANEICMGYRFRWRCR